MQESTPRSSSWLPCSSEFASLANYGKKNCLKLFGFACVFLFFYGWIKAWGVVNIDKSFRFDNVLRSVMGRCATDISCFLFGSSLNCCAFCCCCFLLLFTSDYWPFYCYCLIVLFVFFFLTGYCQRNIYSTSNSLPWRLWMTSSCKANHSRRCS